MKWFDYTSTVHRVVVNRNHLGTAMLDVHLVIREAGERTAQLAYRLAQACGLGPDQISVVSEAPFEEALRQSYSKGLEAGQTWTMTLDGDVLLLPSAINDMLRAANKLPEHYVQLEGRIFDKFSELYRQAGHRIYRTSLLEKALACVPENGAQLRPEYATLMSLNAFGHPSRRIASVVGLHDFEQYYRDLYRKAFVHAKKHEPKFICRVLECCIRNKESDPDAPVIMRGIWDGLHSPEHVSIDKRILVDKAESSLSDLGLNEKAAVGDSADFVRNFPRIFRLTCANRKPPRFIPTDEPPKQARGFSRLANAYASRVCEKGVLSGSMALLGAVMAGIGNSLDS